MRERDNTMLFPQQESVTDRVDFPVQEKHRIIPYEAHPLLSFGVLLELLLLLTALL